MPLDKVLGCLKTKNLKIARPKESKKQGGILLPYGNIIGFLHIIS